jgi:hypothetical protein
MLVSGAWGAKREISGEAHQLVEGIVMRCVAETSSMSVSTSAEKLHEMAS